MSINKKLTQPSRSAPQAPLELSLQNKLLLLEEWLRKAGSVLVAYSGGIDSTLLAFVSRKVLSERMMAVTAYSEIYPARETEIAEEFATQLDIPFRKIQSRELDDPQFSENSPLRCYHCKHELFSRIEVIAREENLAVIVDGQNIDDRKDFRPGTKAAKERNVLSPLVECGFTKIDIRAAAQHFELPNWNKPPHPCLSTRFPYGARLEKGELKKVESAEEFLFGLGFEDVRLRIHGDIARLELQPEDFALLLDEKIRREVIDRLLLAGYTHITMDLEGLISGKMNRALKKSNNVASKNRNVP